MPRFRGRLAFKIVLPFALLTLVIGAIGTLAASSQLNARNQEAFDTQLIHDGFTAQAMVSNAETERLAILHLLTTGPLVAAWSQPALLQSDLERALALHPDIVVETVDPYARELVGVTGHGQATDTVSRNHDLSEWPGVRAMLLGASTHVDLVVGDPTPTVFAGEVLHDGQGRLLGAVLVGDLLGTQTTAIKGALHDDATFYDQTGQVLTTSLALAPDALGGLNLDAATRQRITPQSVVQLSRSAPGPATELLSPWQARGTTLGYLGVEASSAGLISDTSELRLMMAILFLAGVGITLLIGVLLARRITRPLHALVEATRLVSAGDLGHQAPVHSNDEIGELAQSFNLMTESLREKSREVKETMTQLQDTYLMTIEALAAAVEARDPYTHGHTRRVEQYAVMMAEALGCSAEDIKALRHACVLHDIGKIGIEDLILRKQTRLDPGEEVRMQRHSLIAIEMLHGIDFLEPVLPLIRHHHERWDGNGYPDQLREDEIPLGARILAVADALDAMTSDRPYRPARTFEYAKSEILKGSGTHFDPEVVTAFIKSQHAVEAMLSANAADEVQQHPDAGDVGGWRLHVVGH
ncbi:MAG TPA: HD domain-containing phosphohydrolase [Candidatus Limnocylindrales bacterium]|nr:HD domain-containing phosphohydrolase [Candidatus Limnocylindrales bacterium]